MNHFQNHENHENFSIQYTSLITYTCNYLYYKGDGNSQPYSSDLEYLEDNFQLIEILGKALQVEANNDDTSFFRDQRKPETVAREMKAKARSLRAKIGQKMEVTRKLEGD